MPFSLSKMTNSSNKLNSSTFLLTGSDAIRPTMWFAIWELFEKMAKSLLRDWAECSICMDTLEKPKALPCLHTFCLEYLIKYSDVYDPGTSLPCPICTEGFAIPVGGLENLKNNFYIEQQIQAKQASMSFRPNDTKQCSLCDSAVITRYCCDCSDYMCDKCATIHLRVKVSKNHRIVNQEEKQAAIESSIRTRPTFCEIHPKEEVSFFVKIVA